jgi:catechol 2,3-dioxygenase-like lactoylglutathione lyase family enzyme
MNDSNSPSVTNSNRNDPAAPSAAAPFVECEQHHPGLWVPVIPAAVDFYTCKLGFKLGFTWGEPPETAGVNLGDVSIHLALGEPTPNPAGCAVYFVIGDADELYDFHRANGVAIVNPHRRSALRIARLHRPRSPRLRTRLWTSHLPPWLSRQSRAGGTPVAPGETPRRVDAGSGGAQAHMSLSSCFEEILLHTCEPLGDGVASPHPKATLRHIQELKRKHDINYDCHASYRFIE